MQPTRNYLFTFYCLVLNVTSTHAPSSKTSVNGSSATGSADTVLGHHMLPPSWLHTSVGRVSPRSLNRWRTQLALSRSVYSFQVREDTAPGTVVGKVEALSHSLTPITYSVQEDDGENLFLLSRLSGEFLLSRMLDFEAQRFYILTVAAHKQDLQAVSSVRVYFSVLNVNDNPPVFGRQSLSASLPEDSRVGTCFLLLNVTDKDEDDSGKMELNVLNPDGDTETVFFINPAGSLCLSKDLDRERQSSYNLTIIAHDCVQPESLQLTSTAQVTVLVDDVNDNAPVFVSVQTFTVPEDTALHSVIVTVHAKDADAGSNGDVLYYLNGSSSGTFSINDKSGNIYLEETLDREQVDTLTITVTAADGGLPRMATTMNLTMYVGDANDHDPEFPQSTYSVTVREDIPRGISLLQVWAHDDDIGPNGQVRYVLNPASPFVVDSVRGVLTVMGKVDRETDSNYELVLTAVDQGSTPRSAVATVIVTVLDVNDFAPRFSPETLIIHVTENEENPSLLRYQLTALDEDLGPNSQLTYSIQKRNRDGLFSITTNGTFQILHSLDREKESQYIVTITAVDSGLPPLTGSLDVHVIVDDLNDNHPEFTEEVYNTIVYEDSPPGTVFAIITASDHDEGLSGEIRYFIEDTELPFAIEETSGELLTTDVLDRETVASYNVTVISRDQHPTDPLSSSVLVIVLIGDINDQWPQFKDSPYVAHVPSEMAPGSIVFAVSAIDHDSEMNADLHYSFYGPNANLFSIDPNSGTVFTSIAQWRTDDIRMSVQVQDGGESPNFDITTMSMRFHNVSDFPQMNVDVLSFSLSEDEPRGTLVAMISALSFRAEPVLFYLASGNFEDIFHVEQLDGILTLDKPLDYENKKDFTLLVEARDSGLPPFSSFAEIRINVSDVNDNFPQFTQAEYRCDVFENSAPTWVCDILAIDADSGYYGMVWYSITEGNDDRLFVIDPENGLLSTTESLDRENISECILTVEAAEIDNPAHKATATIVVNVLDRNDNAPRFLHVFLTDLPEDAPVGHVVVQMIATDDDIGPNAIINYSIPDQNDDMPFKIHLTTGHITLKRPLDREIQDHYVLKVNANDSAWSVGTDVTIIITDVNDNGPVFSRQSFKAVLPETKDKEVSVLQVVATDADIGQNGEILYVIPLPNEVFWVNASSGDVYTNQPLMLKNPAFQIYQFVVTAFDCGSPPLHSNTTVTIRLEPYNHHAPKFMPLQPVIAIPFHMTVGTHVVQFTAIDPDFSNADIYYTIEGGNASAFFWIQADSGKVMLKQSLRESVNLFLTLIVKAQDQGLPPSFSQTNVTFEITGENQYSPSFGEPDVLFSVPEDLPAGSVIGRIQAEDKDNGLNGVITYSVIPENPSVPLSVGEASGLLTLIEELDFEKEVIYHVQIKAMDGGWVSKTGTVNVTIVVMDVNDNPPVFSSSEFLTSVPENSEIGTNLIDLKATDADSGTNAQIIYSLITGHIDKFAIDSINGTITTLNVFDYEQEHVFAVTVKASNIVGHTLFTLAHVVIQISDVNEFTPVFVKREFPFSVFKNVPVGRVIGNITATDDDQGSEGQVFYLVFGRNRHLGFNVHPLSGEIYTTGSLRKQGNSHVVLKVLAKNRGVISGMDEDETLVRISVIDTNDAPVFTTRLYFVNVTEDSPVGTSVLTVSAVDEDSVLDWNRVFFSIKSGNTNLSFTVDPINGFITVNSPLDRELWAVYNLTVTATDNGSPPATGTTNVVVSVIDVNDNAPKITLTKARVKENEPRGTIITWLNASDSDAPPNQGPFTYWLVNPITDNAFSVTPDGVLATTRPIDREQMPTYQLLLAVRDSGIPSLSSTTMFHIRIMDENDNPSLPRNLFIEVKYFGVSFHGGMIGNVHPEDADESNTFICTVKSGSLNMFTIPNGTCELWSSPFQGEATFNVTIEATDQLHFPVNNSIYVTYKGFTNASIDNCILFYVSLSTVEEFLSSKYLRFVKALDSLFNLQASKTHVFGMKRVGREILLLAAVTNYNGEYLHREVASGISAGHKKLLESQSNAVLSHITTDPCLTSPCQNGATCNKNIYVSQDVTVQESLNVIFVSPQKEVFNCTCPAGFAGTLCQYDIDECMANPCQNKGTCVNTAGSFYCHCQSGFSGSICSIDEEQCLKVNCQNGGTCIPKQDGHYCYCVPGYEGAMCEEFINHCRSAPCLHGTCTNSLTGFTCHCHFGVSGVHCDVHSYGFQELSFMEFPPLDRRTNLISLEFATVQRHSLLLHNPGGSSSREFLALEILDGAVHLSYDLGSGPVRLQTRKKVTDGLFHTVTVRRIGNMGSVHVDNCTDAGNNESCFSQSDGSSSERTLDVGNTNMTIGGMKTIDSILLHPGQIKTHNFVGCARNIHVNGIPLRPSMALTTYNILDKCPRAAESPCQSDPCKNSGVCHDLWSRYICECQSPFIGNNCTTEASEDVVLRLSGNDYIEYVIRERFKRDYLLKESLSDEKDEDQTMFTIKFRTKDNGALMFVTGPAGSVMLKITDKRPVYVFKDTPSGHLSEFTMESPVSDGFWHVLSLFNRGAIVFLALDGIEVFNFTDSRMDLTPALVGKIILGAVLTEDSRLQQRGFSGCVQHLDVFGHTLPFSGHSAMVDVRPSRTLTQSSCVSTGVCFPLPCSYEDSANRVCLSEQCRPRWSCGPAGQDRSCMCLHNVSDYNCDICTTGSRDQCPEDTAPLWVIAVVLPLITILVLAGLLVVIYRLRQQKSQRQILSLKTEEGTDNVGFCFDDNRPLTNAAFAEGHTVNADQQQPGVELYCDPSPSVPQPDPKSASEYYEISSICSEFHSDTTSLKHSLYGTKPVKTDPKQWRDLTTLLAGFQKVRPSEERAKHLTKPQTVASASDRLFSKLDAEQLQVTPPGCIKANLRPQFPEPAKGLTLEEISKLNVPASPSSEPVTTTMVKISSDRGSNSTHSEPEFSQVSAVGNGKHGQDEEKDEDESCSVFEKWEKILNVHLPFSSYAPVFEDLVCLPMEPNHSHDVQSDIEEVI